MTPALLATLRAAGEAATPRPWTAHTCDARGLRLRRGAVVSTKCKHCPHRAHTGFCTARNGTTAYPCPCIHSASGVLPGRYWHCPSCGAEEPVAPTGDGNEYAPGDKEPCITCATGTAYVVKKVRF